MNWLNLFAGAGLVSIRFAEESFVLDFDEWFDRSTPGESKESVRTRLLSGPAIRTFRPTALPGGAVRIDCIRASVRGEKV